MGGFNARMRQYTSVDVSYAAPQAHGIVNVALHREYSLGIIFTFSQGGRISVTACYPGFQITCYAAYSASRSR
jgi:hypothetical protein